MDFGSYGPNIRNEMLLSGATGPTGPTGATGGTGATGPTGPAPSGTAGSVVYLSSSGVAAASANHFWDDTNGRVGVGTSSPSNTLSVLSSNNSLVSQVQISHPAGDWGLVMKRTANDAGSANIAFLKCRGETSNLIMQGDGIGRIAWHAVTNNTGPVVQHLGEINMTNVSFTGGNADGAMCFLTRQTTDSSGPVERMRILPSGNVGIGTTSPGYPLDVNGSCRVQGDMYMSTSNAMTLWGNTFTFRIADSASGAIGTPKIIINSNGPNAGSPQTLVMGVDGAGFSQTAYLDTQKGGVSGITPLTFRMNGTEYMRVHTNGNVGIGTTSPSHSLNVIGNSSYASMTANPQTGAGLSIGTSTGSERLLLGAYYTGGTGSACAIQSSDYYSSSDHGQTLYLNPLGGTVETGGFLHVADRGNGAAIYLNSATWDHLHLWVDGTTSYIDAGGAETGLRFRVTSGNAGYPATSYTTCCTMQPNGYINYGTTYKYNIFYAPPNWSYGTSVSGSWQQLWSFSYNFPQASYVVATISGHWNYNLTNGAAYIGILVDGASQHNSSYYDSYTVGGASTQGGTYHQYWANVANWWGFTHTICIKVTSGSHTFGCGLWHFNSAYTAYVNGAAISLQVTPINYL